MDRRTFNRVFALSSAGSALKVKPSLRHCPFLERARRFRSRKPPEFSLPCSLTRSVTASTESRAICIPANFTTSVFPRLIGDGAWNSSKKRAETAWRPTSRGTCTSHAGIASRAPRSGAARGVLEPQLVDLAPDRRRSICAFHHELIRFSAGGRNQLSPRPARRSAEPGPAQVGTHECEVP